MSYSHGVEGSLMKAKDETEDDMQVCTLKKKQVIDKLFEKRINQTTIEYVFIDQNDNVILNFFGHRIQNKATTGKYKDDSVQFQITQDNLFVYNACENHESHLMSFALWPTHHEMLN